jgi:hypothetical protein
MQSARRTVRNIASASVILRWGTVSCPAKLKRSNSKANSVATIITLDRSNPSCTLNQGLLIIARANRLGPTVFTMTYPGSQE